MWAQNTDETVLEAQQVPSFGGLLAGERVSINQFRRRVHSEFLIRRTLLNDKRYVNKSHMPIKCLADVCYRQIDAILSFRDGDEVSIAACHPALCDVNKNKQD